jgi:adenylosuccinate lyase
VVKAYEETGRAPAGTAEKIRSKERIDVEGIAEIEEVGDHDVIAFIKYVTREMGDEARYFHLGLTSSDIVDTALSLAVRESGLAIIQALTELSQALGEQALIYKDTVCMGRTQGIHAEPTSFGLKFLSFMVETIGT